MQEINLLVEQKNGSIETNFEEIKAALAAGLEEYKGMVFTAESQPKAKKTVASLRKLKNAMNDRRIEIKKKFMEPYTNFEAQVKELDKLIDEPIDFISGQIEEFERRRVEAKKAMICEIYTGIMAEHGTVMEYLPLDRIYDSRWENSTTTQKAITEAITAHEERQKTDSEYADDLERWLGGIKPVKIIIDPSAASFIAELKKRGYAIKKAKNDVLDGIRFVASLLNQGKIAISDQCSNTIKEFGSYIWDQKASERGEDKPVKLHDHAMDALRYFCYTIIRKPGGISILK